MENASQALIIAGAILLAILIIAIGMYIYNSAQSTIQDSITNMSTQEIEAFNNQFESYKGKQKGSQISSLIGRLVGNASTYQDEPGKVPDVNCDKHSVSDTAGVQVSYGPDVDEKDLDAYTSGLATIKNHVESKHDYYVEFEYDAKSGIIDEINITYNNPNGGDEG